MNNIRPVVFAILVIMLSAVTSAFSELVVNKFGISEVIKYPFFRLKTEISDNGNPVDLSKLTVVLEEEQFSVVADSVVPIPGEENKYWVYWRSKSRVSSVYVYFTYGDEVKMFKHLLPSYSAPMIVCFTPLGKPYLFFNKPLPGKEYERPLDILVKPEGASYITIDSIKTFTNYFRVMFTGGHENWNPPPGNYPEGKYYLSIFFNGQDNNFYTDSLVIYFNGGQKTKVHLIANSYKVETAESINIIEPSKDAIWVPCFDKKIVWQGGTKGSKYVVNVSYDGGYQWENIGETLDTFYIWKVNNVPTENALIRVFQRYMETVESSYSDSIGFNYTKYEPYAKMLVASSYGGKIQEFKFNENGDPETYKIRYLAKEEEDEEFEVNGMLYTKFTEDTRELAVAHHRRYLPTTSAKDIVSILKDDEEVPYKTIKLDYKISKMDIDEKCRFLTMLPLSSNVIHIYNTTDYSFDRTLVFEYPVTSFKFTPFGDSLFVSLMNNEVRVLTVPNFEEIARMSYPDNPIITGVATSPDGHFLALSSPDDYSYSPESPVFVYDMKTGVNIRSYYSNRFNPLGMDFNPYSNAIIIGTRLREHIFMRELNYQFGLEYFSFAEDEPNDKMASYSYANREGHRVAAVMKSGNLYINRFAFTESGRMKEPFKIRNPKVKVEAYDFKELLVDNRSDHYLKAVLCNIDELPLILTENSMLQYNTNFTYYLNSHQLPDTLEPGECREFHIIYHANDTGRVEDTIRVSSCGKEYYIPLTSYSMPRNIDFYEKEIVFGEACVNTPKTKIINLLRNLDTIDLKIKQLRIDNLGNYTNFRIKGETENIIVPPNQDLFIELEFTPWKKEKLEAELQIFYTDNPKFQYTKKITGVGIGGEIEISHDKLMFLPEQKKRQVTIKNTSQREMKIKGVRFQPMQLYKIYGQLPIVLQVGDSTTFEVECDDDISQAKLLFDIEPCAVNSVIELGRYTANSTLTLLDKEANPRELTAIDIHLNSIENAPYKGIRPLESEFTIAEKIFLPLSENAITSQYGKGEILRNEVIDGVRHIKFRIEGDFPKEGVIASIKGYPGLSDPTYSDMIFDEGEDIFNFGSAVITDFKSGKFKLTNICGGKMLYWNEAGMKIGKVFPNPADKFVLVDVELLEESSADIEIYNQAGSIVKQFNNINLTKGNNSVELNTAELSAGTYNVIIRTKDDSAGCRITIIK